MAATDTYSAPPDFAGRQTNINTAYNTALAQLQQKQSLLYNQMGYKDGTTNLDAGNQYGTIQQILHSAGGALMADDRAEHSRGLNQDSGLGAQRARLVAYQSGLQRNTAGQQFQGGLADIGNARTGALQTYNTDNTQLGEDQAQWNAQQNAQNDAIANYNKLLQQLSQQASPSETPQAGIGNSVASYLPPATIAAAAAKSKKPVIGKPGNSGIHAM
jgi:hypothetical protein